MCEGFQKFLELNARPTQGGPNERDYITFSLEFKQDLNWFIEFFPHFDATAFFTHYPVTVEIQLDAALQGLGAVSGNEIYAIAIPLGYTDNNIVYLEMLNILVIIHTWGPSWGGKRVSIACDNQAVVSVLNSGRTRVKTLVAMARNIAMVRAKYDIYLNTIHIPAKDNKIADALSRLPFGPQYMEIVDQLVPEM